MLLSVYSTQVPYHEYRSCDYAIYAICITVKIYASLILDHPIMQEHSASYPKGKQKSVVNVTSKILNC